MRINKRIIGILLSLSLMLGASNMVFAAATVVETSGKAVPSKVLAYVKPEFIVQLNGLLQVFKNAKGERIYPLVYNGSTYLPVRSVSALMGEEIEWDDYSQTVFIGKTLNNPNKSKVKIDNENESAAYGVEEKDYVPATWKSTSVTVSIRPDVTIMYDFEIQNFTDADGNKIYPIMYNGSTYLPIRAVSGLMNEPIEWDNITKTVLIGSEKEDEEIEEEVKITLTTKRLTAEFESAVELYDQATAKITGIQKSTDAAILVMMADSISADVTAAEKQTNLIRSMKKSIMTDEEKAAQEALYEFAHISQYYLLVLENIAYLAAEGEDYTMLSETFLNMALESQSKMNAARRLISNLPQ